MNLAFSATHEFKELTIPNSVEKYGAGIVFQVHSDFVLKGTKDSLAKEIAEDSELPYEEIQ